MRAMPTTIRAVISDVDGTLVTGDKTLSGRTRAAVAKLRARGIGFTIMSSRPPRGLGMLLAPLRLTTPFAACNGGIIAAPDLSVIAEHDVPGRIARRAIAQIERDNIESWVFAGVDWLVKEDRAPLVDVGLSAHDAAAAYEATLRHFYGGGELNSRQPLFDVTLLGIGEDGHTASLFPNQSSLDARERWVLEVKSPTG